MGIETHTGSGKSTSLDCAAIVAAIMVSTTGSSKTVLISSVDRIGISIDHSRVQHNVVYTFVGYILSSIQRRAMVVRGRWVHSRFH
jgi:hypothetical protein